MTLKLDSPTTTAGALLLHLWSAVLGRVSGQQNQRPTAHKATTVREHRECPSSVFSLQRVPYQRLQIAYTPPADARSMSIAL